MKLFFVNAIFLALSLIPISALADTVYKWKDANGQIHFGSNPPKTANEVSSLSSTRISKYSSDRVLDRYNANKSDVITEEPLEVKPLEPIITVQPESDDSFALPQELITSQQKTSEKEATTEVLNQ